MSSIKISAYWHLLSPTRARSPVIKRPKHYVFIGAVVKDWCPLSLRTDYSVATPNALATNMLERIDSALHAE